MHKRAAALLSLLALVAAPVPANADAGRVDAAVARIADMVEGERWKSGANAIKQLFADHEGKAAVRGHLKSLEEDLKLCLFRQAAGNVKGSDLFGYPCRRLDRHTRTVKMVFNNPTDEPWTKQGDLFVLPMEFEGAFEIYISKCDFIDKDNNVALVMLSFDPDTDGGYVVIPGVNVHTAEGDLRAPCKILRVGDGEPVTVGSKEYPREKETGRNGTVEIKRQGKTFTVKVGGKKVLSAKDDTYTSGYVALRGSSFRFIVITGRLEKRYFRRMEGAYHAEAFGEWAAESYERSDHIPAWLREDAVEAAPSFADITLLPADAPGGRTGRALTMLVEEALGGREAPASAKMPQKALPPLTAAWFEALDAYALDQHRLCIERLDTVLAADPEFAVARGVRGAARYSVHDMDGAREDLAFACEQAPVLSFAHQSLALVDLYRADLPGAAKVIRDAVSLGHTDATTRILETWIVRAERGPRWARRFDHETKHFIVSSDHGKKMCFETATALEAMRKKYADFLGEAPKGAPKSRVYVFASREGYVEYAGDLGIDLTWTAGVYLPLVRELALWVPEITANLENTVRHEGFHQYFHIFAEGTPPWFNEGMAQVFGDLSGREDRPFDNDPSLREKVIPAAELFQLPSAKFTAAAYVNLHYAQSLRVCRVMRADAKLNTVLEAYRDGLLAGRTHDELYAEVLLPALPAIQSALDKSFD